MNQNGMSSFYCLVLTLLLSGPVMAQQEIVDEGPFIPEDIKNWFQVEILVFAKHFKDIDSQLTNEDAEVIWHEKPYLIPTNIAELIPEKGVERPPQNLEELNTLSHSLQYQTTVRVVPADSTVELEDISLWLAGIKGSHTKKDSLEVIADPESLGQYWPYIKSIQIPDAIFDDTPLNDFYPTNEEDLDSLVEEDAITQVPLKEAFQTLSSKQFKLRDTARRIGRSKNYRVLVHQAWHQPVPRRGQGLPILIRLEDESAKSTPLIGQVTVELGRFLHTEILLQYERWLEKTASIDVTDPEAQVSVELYKEYMTMETKLKMHSNELHYADHPYLSALVIITPYPTK